MQARLGKLADAVTGRRGDWDPGDAGSSPARLPEGPGRAPPGPSAYPAGMDPAAHPIQVAVCGPSRCTEAEAEDARRVGELLAARGVTVLCGGGGGVMAAVAAGVRTARGLVVGILPGPDRRDANPHLSAAVVTNQGQARNAILVQSADAVIAIGGSWGTLSEVALAMRRDGAVPVVCLGGWRVLDRHGQPVPGLRLADTPEHAVTLVCS